MKTLLIGGFGFLGNQLADFIVKIDEVVYIADRASNLYSVSTQGRNLMGSYSSHSEIIRSFDFDAVINLASQLLPGTLVDSSNVKKLLERDFLDAVEVIYTAKERGVARYIFISSGGSVYDDIPGSYPFKETDPIRALNLYGVNKISIESYLQFLGDEKFKTLSLRVSNLYSHAQEEGRKQGIIPIFIRKILRDEIISIYGDGRNVRDFIHLNDAVKAINSARSYKGAHRFINIGSGVGYSVNDIVAKIAAAIGKGVRIEYLPDRGVDKRFAVLDTALAQAELSWGAEIGIDEGISLCLKNLR